MTSNQRDLISKLFEGYYLIPWIKDKYRLRDNRHNPCNNYRECTVKGIRPLLRKSGKFYFIDLRKVRQLNGNSWVKKKYKNQKVSKGDKTYPELNKQMVGTAVSTNSISSTNLNFK